MTRNALQVRNNQGTVGAAKQLAALVLGGAGGLAASGGKRAYTNTQQALEKRVDQMFQNNRSRRGRNRSRRGNRSIPAANSFQSTASFSTRSLGGTSLRVAGSDLLSLGTGSPTSEGVFATYPANPCYWGGTKIASMAALYANYKPVSIRVTYHPNVGTTNDGSVILGSVFGGQGAGGSSIERALYSSNGGKHGQVWSTVTSNVDCTKLNQRMYSTMGQLSDDTNPFVLMAMLLNSSATAITGTLTVNYVFELHNPFPHSTTYITHPPNSLPSEAEDATYVSLICRDDGSDYNIGQIVDADYNSGSWSYSASGKQLAAEPSAFMAYSC